MTTDLSRKENALKLAMEAQKEILTNASTASSVLRKCLTICQLLNVIDEREWIKLELNGYHEKYETIGDLEKGVPESRKAAKVLYYDEYNRPILIDDERLIELTQSMALGLPISELERGVEKGLYIHSGPRIILLRRQFGIPVFKAHVSPLSIQRIVDAVKNRALEFVNQVIIKTRYEGVLSDIFEETKNFVDTELTKICPKALEKLVHTYMDLLAKPSSLKCSQVAFACRDILQDFTDAIYKPEYLPRNKRPPRREQTKNKIHYVLTAELKGLKAEERKLIEASVDFLEEYFDKLIDYIQKQVHPKRFAVTKEDANRCVIYTYLIIGDTLKLMTVRE